MKIGAHDLAERVFIVAEIGNCHEGDFALAEQMIGLAARAGADAVKFQTIVPERLVAPDATERLAQLRRFQLEYTEFEELCAVAARAGVLFLSTPFDPESARFLNTLVPAFKVSSPDNNFFPLLQVIAETGKPILLSTGLMDLEGIRGTKTFIERIWRDRGIVQEMAILHCVTSYPTPPEEANLAAIRTLQELNVTVGYSDHTLGIEAAVQSVAVGARVVEKHFTIAKDYSEFRDHQLAADPGEFADMVRRIRAAETLLGTGKKTCLPCEADLQTAARRSIAAARPLAAGHRLIWEDLTWIRPGSGLAPGRENELLGRRLQRSLAGGEFIRLEDLEERGD